jgi:NADPH2:quinone reductase
VTNRAEVEAASQELFDLVITGKLSIEIGQHFALADAAEAHRALEGRRTTGSTVLVP